MSAVVRSGYEFLAGHTFITFTFSINPFTLADSGLESGPPPLLLFLLDPGAGLVLRLLVELLVYDLSRLGRDIRTIMAGLLAGSCQLRRAILPRLERSGRAQLCFVGVLFLFWF